MSILKWLELVENVVVQKCRLGSMLFSRFSYPFNLYLMDIIHCIMP